MPTLPVTATHELVERALEASRADGCVVIADETSTANLRWAGNALTTNGLTRGRTLTVVATVGGASGTAAGVVSREAVTLDEVESIVRAAEQAAAAAGPAEDAQPLVGPTDLPADLPADLPRGDFAAPPAVTSVDVFAHLAPALGEAFARSRSEGRLLYGFARHELTTTYLGSSTGLRLRHDQPTGTFELNAKTGDRTGSAWSGVATRDFTDVDPLALAEPLVGRLVAGQRRIDLPAGRYEVILPPSAVADLLIYQLWSASGRDAHEGRTVFSKRGGGTRVGEQLSSLPLTLYSDPAEPGLGAAPFLFARASGNLESAFDNGLPLTRTDWVRDGRLTNLVTTRHTAQLTGLPVRPGIDNLVLRGGPDTSSASLEDLVARTTRGLLLTCLWYIREVDPATLLLTGLTRDGVYLVEDGEIVGSVNNFRFNESPVDLLARITEVGSTQGCLPREWSDWFTRTAMPPVRVPDFNMSSVSQAS